MNVAVEKLEKNFVKMTVEVPSEEVGRAVAKAVKSVAAQVNIPGFRRGKAPRSIIEARIGKDYILNEALDILLPKAYEEGLVEADLHPIDRPEIDKVDDLVEGKPFVFSAKIQVLPEVTLGDYKSVRVEKPAPEVTDAEVDEAISALQERFSELVSSEKTEVEKGDFAVIDFEGFVDGQPVEGAKAEGYTVEVGSGRFVPGFEEQLVGAKVGEGKQIEVTFPEDYGNADLAGKDCVFNVKVNEVKVKKLPELDDEFAKDVGNYQSMDELKEKTRARLLNAATNRIEREFEDRVLESVLEVCSVELPNILVERAIDSMLSSLTERLKYQGLDMERYLEIREITETDLRNELRADAEKQVKTELVLDAVAKAEGLSVSDAELDQRVKEMAEKYGKTEEVMRKYYEREKALDSLRDSMLTSKTVELLKSYALGQSA